VIPLNVAELVEDELHHPGLMGLGEALENFDRHFDTINSDADVDAWDYGIDTITARYTEQYRLYAQRFTIAAALVRSQVPGLTADVLVEADTDPNSRWWSGSTITNPHCSRDPLVQQLWCAAHDATPLPNIDIWPGSQPSELTKGVMVMDTIDRLMTLAELAEMLGVPVNTVYQWRTRGEGPPGYRIGRHMRYRRSAVELWLETQTDHQRVART
jgi:excisionase family DNA binding protein